MTVLSRGLASNLPEPTELFRCWSWQCSSLFQEKQITSKVWLIEGVFLISLSKPCLIIFSEVCICFKLKPAADSKWCIVLGATDRKNKGRLVKLPHLKSLVCSGHFVLLTETAGDSHQTIPCGAAVLPIVSAHSATNRRWRIWSGQHFDYPQMVHVVAGKIEMLE